MTLAYFTLTEHRRCNTVRRTWSIRVLCLIMMTALALPPITASADVVTSNGKYIPLYTSADESSKTENSVVVPEQEAGSPNNGFYYVPSLFRYFRAADLTIVNPTPSPTPSASPTPIPNASSSPGVTPSPTPELISGEKDPTYEGKILSYTVPAGGLWLYNAVGGSAAVSISAGATIKLTSVQDEAGWYSVYYSGKTYYVPESILYLTDDAVKNTASVVLKSGTIYLYTKANAGTTAKPPDLTANRSSNTLEGGSRIPAKYYNAFWYTYQLGSSTYYIYAGDVEGGLNSSASVGSNEDTTLMREYKVPAGATLYRVMDLSSTNSYTLTSAQTLYGVSVNSEWNRVMYADEVFYLNSASVTSSTQVAVASSSANATYWVTVGMNGAYLYKTRTRNVANPEVGNVGKLPAGQSILASPVDTLWYSYSSGTNLYYIYGADLGTSTSTSSMSSIRVFLKSGTALYDKMTATNPTSITLTSSDVTLSDGSIGDYYVVQSVNDTWYSITYDSKLYYIKKADSKTPDTVKVITLNSASLYDYIADPAQSASFAMPYTGTMTIKETLTDAKRALLCAPPAGEKWYYVVTDGTNNYLIATSSSTAGVVTDIDYSNPIATTTAGKEYYVTIGLTTATLFRDAACTQAATVTIKAGEVVLATKYTDSLYIVSSGGAKYYLPIRYISSIRGGDDAAAVNTSTTTDSISDVVKGESNPNFSGNVFNYKIPVSGLWLYYKMENSARSISLNYGASIQLIEVAADPNWYTTWYGGSQYYVPKTSLSVSDGDVAVNNTYSITLGANATLYTSSSFSAVGVPAATNKSSGITLNAGARVNVRVMSKATGGVAIYAYTHMDGKTYYFTSLSVVADSALSATVDSNTNTSFITQFVFRPTGGMDTIRLYTSPSTSSSSTDVSFATKEMTLYGVKYSNEWDKVIYNNATWYMLRAEYLAVTSLTPEQISISTQSATSTTFTVVIGSSEALLYTRTDSTNNTYYSGFALSPGDTILASKVSATWYSCAMNGNTYYFLASKIANNNSTSAVSSYIISISAADNVALYNTISATGLSTLSLPDGSYTMRKINSEWSSVFYNGKTYYVKNADLPAEAVFQSTPIATTTVGKTYKITIGKTGADVFTSGKLAPPKVASLEGGYQTTGTKLYISGSNAPNGLVYSISHGGQIRYISAAAVTGIMEGDEVEEAKKAAEDAAKTDDTSPVAIGTTSLQTFNIGSIVYADQSTTSTKFSIPSTMILSVTKVNANWYSISYAGKTYYVPVSDIEKGTGTTTTTTQQVTVSVGESYTLTFTKTAPYYGIPDKTQPQTGTIQPGEVYSIKRVSDEWYEITINTRVYYMLATDVVLPVITITVPVTPTTTTTTHDGTGYITQYLTVSVASGSLNLRKTASTSSVVLDRIPNGAQMTNNSYYVDSAKKVWYNVSYGGRTGYVLGDYIKPVGTGSSTEGTSTNPALDIGRSFLVNTASVNIRSGAGMKYSILGRLDKNVSVTPIDYATGDDNMIWYKFQFTASLAAWIRSDYLAGSAVSSTEQSGNVAIKQGDTNVRSGPGDSFSVVVRLPRDTIVSIVGKGTDANELLWYRIVINNVSGYVRSDLVRPLTAAETSTLMASVIGQYTELRYGSKGPEVKTLQEQLIRLGYMAAGTADGVYGPKTTDGVKQYQRAKGMTETGVATRELQAQLYNTSTSTGTGFIQSLDWFATGYNLISANKNVTIYDIPSGISWNARYINGANHADVIPASKADATKLVANNVVGSYVRRSVIVTIAGTRYAGSMYALGHGTTNYCDYFNGVMCIHFTGSKTHGTGNVDADHQAAINAALTSGL